MQLRHVTLVVAVSPAAPVCLVDFVEQTNIALTVSGGNE
jgi:hypothetical protein